MKGYPCEPPFNPHPSRANSITGDLWCSREANAMLCWMSLVLCTS
ncbi:hypothetical protein NC651_022828 [Populus alba x Populus x berolinensis]|nr:hypothetical protein NC651_022828 [Populus alba x Populus x berolinensis]